jgi:2-keto-3-deoxy-L-rhamnonate aldolase RhmA
MRSNRAKAKIANGELALNGFFYIPDPTVVELMGQAGYDAVSFDLQHLAWDLDTVRRLILAADFAGVAPIVRIGPGDWGTALRTLDAGAQGIMVSDISSLEIAREAVDAVRYAPVGRRGAHGYIRASGYGATPWQEHTASSNEEVLLIVTVEDQHSLEAVEDIAALDGVDVITFGPHDLAESMGIHHAGDPRVREAIMTGVEKIKAVGKARFGLPTGYPAMKFTVEELIELGGAWTSVMPPADQLMLRAMKEAVGAARASEANARTAVA